MKAIPAEMKEEMQKTEAGRKHLKKIEEKIAENPGREFTIQHLTWTVGDKSAKEVENKIKNESPIKLKREKAIYSNEKCEEC